MTVKDLIKKLEKFDPECQVTWEFLDLAGNDEDCPEDYLRCIAQLRASIFERL